MNNEQSEIKLITPPINKPYRCKICKKKTPTFRAILEHGVSHRILFGSIFVSANAVKERKNRMKVVMMAVVLFMNVSLSENPGGGTGLAENPGGAGGLTLHETPGGGGGFTFHEGTGGSSG